MRLTCRHIFNLSILICAVFFSVGCAKVRPSEYDKCQEIAFSTHVLNERTKADIRNVGRNIGSFSTDLTFGTHAWMLPEGKTWDRNSSESVVYIDKAEVSFSENKWSTSYPVYWPQNDRLTFFSFYPYSLIDYSGFSIDRGGIKIANLTVVPKESSNLFDDIMLSEVVKDCGQSQIVVPTVFSHKLSKIKFKARLNVNNSSDRIRISSIKLTNIYTQGSFNYTKWEEYSGIKDVVVSNTNVDLNQTNSEMVIGEEMVVLPQHLLTDIGRSAPQMIIEYYDTYSSWWGYYNRRTKTIDLSSIIRLWSMNSDITYILIFDLKEEYIDFDTNVNPWGDGNGPNIEVD